MKRYTLIYCIKDGIFKEKCNYETYDTFEVAKRSLDEYYTLIIGGYDGFVYLIDNTTNELLSWIK